MNLLLMRIILISEGFTAIIVQSVLVRELALVFSGNELSIGFIFAFWTLWTAFGGVLGGRLVKKIKDITGSFANTLLLISVIFPLLLLAIRMTRFIVNVPPGEMIGIGLMITAIFFAVAPLSIIGGMQFTIGCRIYSDEISTYRASAGAMYGYDALGDLIGGAMFSYVLVYYLDTLEMAFVVSIVNVVLMIMLLWKKPIMQNVFRLTAGAGLIISIIFIIITGGVTGLNTGSSQKAWKNIKVNEVAYSKYGIITVTQEGSIHNFYENGSLLFSNPDRFTSEMLVHIPMCEVENPKNILIIGSAVSGILNETLKHNVERIDYIEMDKTLIETAKKYITDIDKEALADKRVNVINTDGRLWARSLPQNSYDCIIVAVGDPLTLEINRYYTYEFYKELKRILNKKGVVTFSINSNDTYLASAMKTFNAGIYHTLKKVFPNIVLVPGDILLFVAGSDNEFLTDNSEIIAKRISDRNLDTAYFISSQINFIMFKERMDFIRGELENYSGTYINKDFSPKSYYSALSVYAAQFSFLWEKIFSSLKSIKWLILFPVILLVLSGMVLSNKRVFVPLVVAYTGCIGISLELVVIYGFQMVYGNVYNMMGIIISACMAGIVIGAKFMQKKADKLLKPYYAIMYIQIFLCLTALILPGILVVCANIQVLSVKGMMAKALFPFMSGLGGIAIGMTFSAANRLFLRSYEEYTSAAGILYASDLAGASFGAICLTLVVLPLFGIAGACIILSAGSLVFALKSYFLES
ncbi:MAG: fused MFS/spermidine synthase [Elusimicrobiota bacterium]